MRCLALHRGSWEDNLRSGLGEMLYADGAIYNGYWRDDQRNGKGRHVFPPPTNEVYDGEVVFSRFAQLVTRPHPHPHLHPRVLSHSTFLVSTSTRRINCLNIFLHGHEMKAVVVYGDCGRDNGGLLFVCLIVLLLHSTR